MVEEGKGLVRILVRRLTGIVVEEGKELVWSSCGRMAEGRTLVK
jgi:hypothetical protein